MANQVAVAMNFQSKMAQHVNESHMVNKGSHSVVSVVAEFEQVVWAFEDCKARFVHGADDDSWSVWMMADVRVDVEASDVVSVRFS